MEDYYVSNVTIAKGKDANALAVSINSLIKKDFQPAESNVFIDPTTGELCKEMLLWEEDKSLKL